MREIYVNLWDDYKQKPYHDHTEPTTLTIESTDRLKTSEIILLRQTIIVRCLIWKEKEGEREVQFIENDDKYNVIDIHGLDADKREKLDKYLCRDRSAFDDIRITWLMES